MSRENRFERLENDIVDALRRAPGATPSADLDARVLARAHAAVATSKPRPQPIWFSMAAGLVVLVGSGLALRIWQQVEHAPSALDMPAAKVAAPAKSAADADATASGTASRAESADGTLQRRLQEQPAQNEERQFAAPAAPAAMPAPDQQALSQERDTFTAAASKLEVAPSLAAPAVSDTALDAPAAAAPRPFPAAEPAGASAPVTSTMTAEATEQVAPAKPASAPTTMAIAPAPAAAPKVAEVAPAPPAAAPAPAPADDLGVIDLTPARRQPGADAAAAAGVEITGAVTGNAQALAKRDAAEQAEQSAKAISEDSRTDAFASELIAVRKAIAAGDHARARRLLAEVRRKFPQRELPEDLRIWADRPQ